ncbi:hypothetical protein AK830_g7291 [Neonectria ditissima]|uniref:NACHT domain-containing protein n=1 Tax=Neonectria ditissima TaxID=78410 RepID=A0A0P7BGH5_9HYPO|nr:hypothetical protein AK830_g7291 [Neonectria ditissima]
MNSLCPGPILDLIPFINTIATIVPVTINYEVSQPAEGQYEVKQVAAEDPAELNSGNRKEFSFDVKIFSCTGYYDPDTKTIGAYPKILGQQIGDGILQASILDCKFSWFHIMDIFTTTTEAIRVTKVFIDEVKTAAKAEETVQNLFKTLDSSKELIEQAEKLFGSLSLDDAPQSLTEKTNALIHETLSAYVGILDTLKSYFRDGSKKKPVLKALDRSWKGFKWVVDDSWVKGRIEEINEQDRRVQDALRIFNAIKTNEIATAHRQLQFTLEGIQNGLDAARFFDVIKQLPVSFDRSPQSILGRLKNSPPNWILNETPFQVWLQSPSSVNSPWLWILGESGSGKSHLATFLAQHLLSQDMDESPSQRAQAANASSFDHRESPQERAITAVAIHYCSFTERDNQMTDRVLRCILRQLMHHLWNAAPLRAFAHVRAIQQLVHSEGVLEETDTIHSVLQYALQSFHRVYLVIDGLDELSTAALRDLLHNLRTLRSPAVKFVATSREGLRAHAEANRAEMINANNNEVAIQSFVYGRLSQIASRDDSDEYIGPSPLPERLTTEAQIRDLSERIVRISSGNFLCAGLQIDRLKDQEPEDLDGALENLTAGLDDLVKQALDRIESSHDQHKAQVGRQALLSVMYANSSSMSLVELQHALAFSLYSDNSDLSEFSKQKISEATCYFLSVGSSSDSVSIHKAIKDFCVNTGRTTSYFGNPHATIAKTCLGCLSRSREDSGNRKEWKRAIKASPFLAYAASNWGWHMSLAHESLPAEPFQNLSVIDLLAKDRFLDMVTIAIQPQLEDLGVWKTRMWKKLKSKLPPISALHVLAFYNLPETAKAWLDQGNNVEAFDEPSQDETEYTPLYVAATLGHDEVVNVLLKYGADPNRPNGPNIATAFISAVINDHDTVVDTILEDASPTKAEEMIRQRDHQGRLPLANACGNINHTGNVKIVRRILKVVRLMQNDHEILLDRAGPVVQTALHRAAESDNGDVIDALLAFPKGRKLLEMRNKKGDTPLIRAAWASWQRPSVAIQHLLAAGADPLAQTPSGNTAAHTAAHHEGYVDLTKTECFQLLLPVSDLSIQNKHGRNVLHIACKFGRPNHVGLILSSLGDRLDLLFATGKNGHTPIVAAVTPPEEDDKDWEKLFQGKMLCVAQLIPKMGDDISKVDAEELLRVLQRYGQAQPFDLLLSHSSTARRLFEDGSVMLRKAVLSGHCEIVKVVMERYGKDDLNKLGPQDQTLVVEAAKLGHGAVVKFLIDQGAEIGASSEDGDALQWCVNLCNAEVVDAIWARQPNALMPSATSYGVMQAASARNPVRRLWRAKGLAHDINTIPTEVECLRSMKSGISVLVGDEKTARKFQSSQDDDLCFLGTGHGTYLESERVPDTAKIPLSKIHVSITGKDQGWSQWQDDHPHHKGKFHGSDTWFHIAIKRDDTLVTESEITRNLLNVGDWTTSQSETPGVTGHARFLRQGEAQSFINLIRPGDQLCIIPRAAADGWECWIKEATIRLYYED